MSRTIVYDQYRPFQDGRADVEDDERLKPPRISTTDNNVEKVKSIMTDDRRIPVRVVTNYVGKSTGTYYAILGCFRHETHDKKRISPNIVNKYPKLFKRVLADNETWE